MDSLCTINIVQAIFYGITFSIMGVYLGATSLTGSQGGGLNVTYLGDINGCTCWLCIDPSPYKMLNISRVRYSTSSCSHGFMMPLYAMSPCESQGSWNDGSSSTVRFHYIDDNILCMRGSSTDASRIVYGIS